MPYLVRRKLGKFDPRNESIDAFANRFRAHAEYYHWDDDCQLIYLKQSVPSESEHILWDKRRVRSIDGLFQSLRDRYPDRVQAASCQVGLTRSSVEDMQVDQVARRLNESGPGLRTAVAVPDPGYHNLWKEVDVLKEFGCQDVSPSLPVGG